MSCWLTCILCYMTIGIVMLEWALSVTRKLRTEDKARDQKYPAFSRSDLYNLKRWQLYIGAVTVAPLRFALSIGIYIFAYFCCSLTTIGWDRFGKEDQNAF